MSTVGHGQSIRSKFWSKNNKPALMEKLTKNTKCKKDNWNNFYLIKWLPDLLYKTINVMPASGLKLDGKTCSNLQCNIIAHFTNCRGIRSFTQPDRSELSTQAYSHPANLRSDVRTHTQVSSPKTPSASRQQVPPALTTFFIHNGSCKLRQ